jgi:hypothetical protein
MIGESSLGHSWIFFRPWKTAAANARQVLSPHFRQFDLSSRVKISMAFLGRGI